MNKQIKRTPVTIVTGFLGSGKTTLLNRLLNETHGKRIAVIENEFGEVSIDDALLVDTKQPVFKMSNGCLCCTINGDLVRTLTDLIERRSEFDYVIIETTGLANPAPVVQTFMVNEDINEVFELDAVITTVDAKHLDLHIDSKECKEQIALADIVILNKLDLVDDATAAAIELKIRALNAIAVLHKAERSQVALENILDQHAFSGAELMKHGSHSGYEHSHEEEKCEHAHEHHGDSRNHEHGDGESCSHEPGQGHGHLHSHQHDEDVQSVGCELPGDLDRAKFNTWFGQLLQDKGDQIYRCKGILSIAGEPMKVVVQAVHRVVEVTTASTGIDGQRSSKIVFIGKALNRIELIQGFKSCSA